jgi:hypothetical protein
MQIARAFKTDRIWIINVGDIKHHELPAEWFLHLAYDFDAWPINSVDKFLRLWAAREFGKAHSEEIADIVAQYSVSRVVVPARVSSSCLRLVFSTRHSQSYSLVGGGAIAEPG